MRFEPGLVPIIIPPGEDNDFSDTTYDCFKGFIAPTVGLGYYQCITEVNEYYVISHILSGYCLPEKFHTEQQVQSMIIALAECGIDWWLPLKELQALPAWKSIGVTYDGIVKSVCSEVDASASTTDVTNGA